jgi:hypothetical protein
MSIQPLQYTSLSSCIQRTRICIYSSKNSKYNISKTEKISLFYGIMTRRGTPLLEMCVKAKEITTYLSQLGQELTKAGVQEPMHVLMIGGAVTIQKGRSKRQEARAGPGKSDARHGRDQRLVCEAWKESHECDRPARCPPGYATLR